MLKIEVLGPGCPKCQMLEKNVRAAVEEMEIEAEVTKVSDIKEIASRGVLMTPGLVVDGKVVSSGHLLSVIQVKNRLEGHAT
ncbi:MAG: thioredoxin family protein [Gemmatimonadetes bacterium]|nr:TM0996/MTH895 family glutaredoxin-like protein [Gemmatimonadota bacterium]NNM06197.1 thioredoxin family protein [Gemmatimonadota bacterium]